MEKRLLEISNREKEIRSLLEDESKEVDLDAIQKELRELDAERKDIEARSLRKNIAESINTNKVETRKIEEENMEKKYTISSPEYRSAWAKKMMKLSDDRFTEEEKRALGDAITTTATEYVASSANAEGVNNGGLFIPTSVRTDILELIEKVSPFFRDIRRLTVNSNIDLPYLANSDDASWVSENEDTPNEGAEYGTIKLTGFELAKDVVVTWKLESMAVDDFIPFIEEEIADKMGKALINAIIYESGSKSATGAIYNLTAIEGSNVIDTIIKTYKSLSEDARVGAKIYISSNANIEIVSYKDNNGNYPYLNGISSTKLGPVEVDPFLKGGDIMVGNPRNYILNESEPLSIIPERHAKGRKTTYAGYMIADGKPKPNSFAKGSFVAKETEEVSDTPTV